MSCDACGGDLNRIDHLVEPVKWVQARLAASGRDCMRVEEGVAVME